MSNIDWTSMSPNPADWIKSDGGEAAPSGFESLRAPVAPPAPGITPPAGTVGAGGATGGFGGDPFFLAHPSSAAFATDPEMRNAFLRGTGPFARLRMQ